MKKVILGIALLSQFSYGVESVPRFMEIAKKDGQSLVPLSFFQVSESRFKGKLEESVQNINKGADLETEVVALGDFCHSEFEYARKEANGIFSKWVDEQLADQEEKMRETIASKDEEIRNLQARLDSLLNESPNISEGIKILDEQKREAEENVRKIRNKAMQRNIPDDMFMEGQEDLVNTVSGNVFTELNARKEEIQQRSKRGAKNVEDILGKTQYMYGINAKSLIQNLELQHRMRLSYIASQYNEKRERMEEAHEQQKSLLQKMIDKATALNLKLKKEKELHECISRVFIANPSLRPEKITVKSAAINSMTDIFKKRDVVQNEYSKFEFFSGLLGREDLGVNAKQSDLTKISEYLNNTKIGPRPNKPALIGNFVWNGRVHELCDRFCFMRQYEYSNKAGEIARQSQLYPLILKYGFGGNDIMGKEGVRKSQNWFNHCKDLENQERMNTYNNAMSARNAEISRASSIPFPSGEFDRLVDQFNTFLSKL